MSTEAKTLDLLPLVALCVKLASQAGAVIEDVFLSGDLHVVDKNRASKQEFAKGDEAKAENPQSIADRNAQALIVAGLKAQYPTLLVRGEEDGDVEPVELGEIPFMDAKELPDSIPSNLSSINIDELVLWVDPLDGTREFTQGIKEAVTCLIGICHQGRPIAGVINRPFSGETVSAIVGVGWFLHGFSAEKSATITEIHRTRSQERRVVLTSRSHGGGILDEYISTVNPDGIVRAGGCGGKVLMMMEGVGDAYVFPKRGTKKWDTAAPEAVLLAYGGKLTQPDGTLLNYEDVASNVQNSNGLIATHNGGSYHDSFCRL